MKINKFNLPTIYTRVIDNFNLGNLYPKPSTYLKNCKKISFIKCQIVMIPRDSLGTQHKLFL